MSTPLVSVAQEDKDYPWLDTMHENIADSVGDSAIWFDNFFLLEGNKKQQNAKGEVRIKLAWEPRSRSVGNFESRFRVRVRLPNLKNRLDVVLSDYDDELDRGDDTIASNDRANDRERISLALRWRAKPDSGFSHRIGVGRRLQPFVKSRYRNDFTISKQTNVRWETSVYYYNRDGFGAHFSAQLDHSSSAQSLYRFDNNFYFRDQSNDWLWRHAWQNLYQLNKGTAIISGYYIEGLSQPNYRLDEHLASVRWRQNTLRDWLFYEIEPFILWRRDESFAPSYGLALRLEGFFGHN
jgi:hypothetical protein